MLNPKNVEYKAYFEQLIDATRSGSIIWEEVNPTTFVWESREPHPGKFTLQRLEQKQQIVENGIQTRKTTVVYLLQASDLTSPRPRLSITGAQDEGLNTQLDALYELIKSQELRRNLDFLTSLLPPKKNI